MITKLNSIFQFAALTVFLSVSVPALASVVTFDPRTGGTGTNNNQSVGWQFDVLNPITVDALEWYDPTGNGLSTAHTVGIWDASGVLLTSALIPAGATAPLDGLFFRSVAITPVSLLVGNGYIIGGENLAANADRLACSCGLGGEGTPLQQTVDTRLAFVNATSSELGAGFTRPSFLSTSREGFYGPNFSAAAAVPEPSSVALLSLGVATLIVFWRFSRSFLRVLNSILLYLVASSRPADRNKPLAHHGIGQNN